MTTRAQIIVRGIVQGVGFRPFVYSSATGRALNGRVLNNAAGVLIDLEGDASDIDHFVRELESNPPPSRRSSRSNVWKIWFRSTIRTFRFSKAIPQAKSLFRSRRMSPRVTIV